MTAADGQLEQIEADVRRIRKLLYMLLGVVVGAAIGFLGFGGARGAAIGILGMFGIGLIEELRRVLARQ